MIPTNTQILDLWCQKIEFQGEFGLANRGKWGKAETCANGTILLVHLYTRVNRRSSFASHKQFEPENELFKNDVRDFLVSKERKHKHLGSLRFCVFPYSSIYGRFIK